MFEQGYTTLFSIRGIPVRAHWTILLGFLIFSGGRFAPGAWVAYFVLVVLHEFGHAYLARRYGLRVYQIDVHGLGGVCMYDGRATLFQRSAIAWGGVLAQFALLLCGLVYVNLVGWPNGDVGRQLAEGMIGINALLIGLNLLPFKGLDGGSAWKLPRLVYLRWQQERIRKRLVKPKTARSKQRRLEQDGEPKLKLVRDDSGDFRFERDDEEEEQEH